jgi:general secretion pathway protein D
VRTIPRKLLIGVTLIGLLAGCATHRYTRRASEAIQTDNWDAAVYFYLEALGADPGNMKLKMDLQRARIKGADVHFQRGMRFKELGDLQRARTELELAVQLDPTHQYAAVELEKVRSDLKVLNEKGGAAKLEAMKKAASEMKVKPPVLNPTSKEPITLSFPNPTSVREIYKAIAQAFGFNVMFDPKLRDSRITIELRDVTAKQALEDVIQAAGDFYKVLDEKTIIVVEDTPQNRRDYEDLVVKTFFLSNADVKDINNMLRSLIDARRIAVNEQLNSLAIRDTADKVAIAERLINANDKSRAEVLVDVELMQVDSSKLRTIGTSLSSYSYPITFDSSAITGDSTKTTIPLPRLGDITRSMWGLVVPNLTLDLVKSSGEAETLAQPELRITEGEKGDLIIGDKVPIPTTTFNTTQTVGGNIVPITSFQYQDVGIKIDIQPRVHHNNEVTLKLSVEVSQLGDQIDIGNGQKQYEIGTRTITSVIRLKDGETSLLAGLFRYNKNTSRAGLPWLSDLPVIGALFRSNTNNVTKTDLILTLTPHIVRYPDITEQDLAPLWVGTENRVSVFGNSPQIRSGAERGPFGTEEGAQGAGDQRGRRGRRGEGDGGNGSQGEASPGTRTMTLPNGQTIQVPRRRYGGRGSGTTTPNGGTEDAPSSPVGEDNAAPAAATEQGQTATASAAAAAVEPVDPGITGISFYPRRLPILVGNVDKLTVVLDPGYAGATGPLNFAYDPLRLAVVDVEGGDLPTADGNAHVQVTHTPSVGWITVGWDGTAIGSGTLMTLSVSPRQAGELPLIFAGPMGSALVANPATILGLQAAAPTATQGEQP